MGSWLLKPRFFRLGAVVMVLVVAAVGSLAVWRGIRGDLPSEAERAEQIGRLEATVLPVLEDLEGRVPAAILRADAGKRRVEQAGATVAVQSKATARKEPTAEEREALLKQMKILGYMD